MPQERGLYRDMRVLDLLVVDRPAPRPRQGRPARPGPRDLLERLGLGDRGQRQDPGPLGRHGPAGAAGRGDGPRAGRCSCSTSPSPASTRWPSSFLSRGDPRPRPRPGGTCCSPATSSTSSRTCARRSRSSTTGGSCSRATSGRSRRPAPTATCASTSRVDPAGSTRRPAEVGRATPSGTRLRLAPGADPGAVLDAVRAHGPVRGLRRRGADPVRAVPRPRGRRGAARHGRRGGPRVEAGGDGPAQAPGWSPGARSARPSAARASGSWSASCSSGSTAAMVVPGCSTTAGRPRYDGRRRRRRPRARRRSCEPAAGASTPPSELATSPTRAAAGRLVDDGDVDVARRRRRRAAVIVQAGRAPTAGRRPSQQVLASEALAEPAGGRRLSPADVDQALAALRRPRWSASTRTTASRQGRGGRRVARALPAAADR